MQSPREIRVGSRVRILQPDYVSGKTGVVLSQEIISDGTPSDRWIIQVENEDIIVSLASDDFLVFGLGTA